MQSLITKQAYYRHARGLAQACSRPAWFCIQTYVQWNVAGLTLGKNWMYDIVQNQPLLHYETYRNWASIWFIKNLSYEISRIMELREPKSMFQMQTVNIWSTCIPSCYVFCMILLKLYESHKFEQFLFIVIIKLQIRLANSKMLVV